MVPQRLRQLKVIDSHTGGEPTRIVVEGGPPLGAGSLADRRRVFAQSFDDYRSAIVNEPRGSDVLVGGLLCEPHDPACDVGVIFFNNVGMLNMCGHGTIGLAETLRHLGRAGEGVLRIDTPVGPVEAQVLGGNRVSLRNVASYRHRADVTVEVEGHGPVTGDVAWGGNWFFSIGESPLPLTTDSIGGLTSFTGRVRRALEREGVAGDDGGTIDHIEVFGPGQEGGDSRNFVLCPGGAYDRSPCGTGTSAKLACLAADGKLSPGEVWRQESIVGSVFEGSYELAEAGRVTPTVTGSAHVTAEATLILDPDDPFCMGIPQ